MFRYVLGFILAVVIITAGIVAIVILYDEETPAPRPADAQEAANRGTESVAIGAPSQPARSLPLAQPQRLQSSLCLRCRLCLKPRPILLATPSSTERFGGEPAMRKSCKLSSMKVERLMPATIRAIRSCTPRSGGPPRKKYRYL